MWPAFTHIGEQIIQNQELYFDDVTPANNELAFGYQERYAEYRYKPSKILVYLKVMLSVQ